MYLKSLKLAGFKSFADRVRLEFRPGVTVIVGPNGSGKSNLVDALSWVLGSQSAKSLRTPRMEDVIFAGTATRPSLGKAEATLIIDNAERVLDIDLDEIAITRRLYRDGSSDYELNGVGCRLLDIQDLLSDSGVGRHQHVIIGQGEIGRVLNASPEEHRAVIEEAAGILKHRRRKEKSERRLERTDEDVVRLHDVLGEITRQMRPLRRQAKAAERYEGLKSEVVALRLYLSGTELRQLDRDLTIAVSERSALTETLDVDRIEAAGLSAELNSLSGEVGEVANALERDTGAAARLETTVERFKRIASVAQERVRAASGRQEAATERKADLDEERDGLRVELAGLETTIANAESAAAAAESLFRSLDDEEKSAAAQNAMSPEGALAVVRGELSAIETALDREKRESEEVERRLGVLKAQVSAETSEIDQINLDVKDLDRGLGGLQDEYESMSTQARAAYETLEAAEQRLSDARVAHAGAVARVEAVTAALEGRFDPEARRTAQNADGALGTLVSRLDVPDHLATAVGVALGAWEDAVAFSNPELARSAVEGVRAGGGGSVSIVSSPSAAGTPAREVAARNGLEALVDLLGKDADQALATRFLGDVVLVEGWATGWAFVARHPALRAVTPEGDLITVSGVRLGDPDGAGATMLESAEVSLETAERDKARALSGQTTAAREFESSRELERVALERLENAEAKIAGLSEAMGRLQRSVDGLVSEQNRLTERKASLEMTSDRAVQQRAELKKRLEALEGEEAERLAAWESLEFARLKLAADKEEARASWHDATAALRAVAERRTLLTDRLRRVDEEVDRLEHGAYTEIDPDKLNAVADMAKRAGVLLEERLATLRERQSELRAAKAGLSDQVDTLRSQYDSKTSSVSGAQARIGELDVRTVELRMRREAVVEAIRRDAGGDVEAAMAAERPDVEADVDLDALMEEKASQLRRLGVINPLAAQEYRQLEERHDFLADQLADVEASRSELRKVITALEDEIESRFESAFAEVSAAYQRYFETLFPGGRGKVSLVDPEDPQSGVEINAQPLGKKVSQMSLLSGGERSLAALAFLFSIFDARPSPFYVLDEVEAALDDANLRRFLKIVEEFRNRAQLVIITHQQQTMEAADVLYGVTMEPGGSSQAIRKDMANERAKATSA